jgi:hypothetical protein
MLEEPEPQPEQQPTPAPQETPADDLFPDLNSNDSLIPQDVTPSDGGLDLDNLQGSRLQRRRYYTYARRAPRPTKRSTAAVAAYDFERLLPELAEMKPAATEHQFGKSEDISQAIESTTRLADARQRRSHNPLRPAVARAATAEIRQATYELPSDEEIDGGDRPVNVPTTRTNSARPNPLRSR